MKWCNPKLARVKGFGDDNVLGLSRYFQRRSARLVAQLLPVGVLYMLAWYPYAIIVLIQTFKKSDELAMILSTYFVYIPYLQSSLLPFSCILFMP